jgi:hypothetical protein
VDGKAEQEKFQLTEKVGFRSETENRSPLSSCDLRA